jgi:hypothetical protein
MTPHSNYVFLSYFPQRTSQSSILLQMSSDECRALGLGALALRAPARPLRRGGAWAHKGRQRCSYPFPWRAEAPPPKGGQQIDRKVRKYFDVTDNFRLRHLNLLRWLSPARDAECKLLRKRNTCKGPRSVGSAPLQPLCPYVIICAAMGWKRFSELLDSVRSPSASANKRVRKLKRLKRRLHPQERELESLRMLSRPRCSSSW